jgi:two-component system OmpR family sensor kinase
VSLRPKTLRGRLAVVFALVTVVLSALVATFVLLRYQSDLRVQLDQNLRTRYADVRSELARAPRPISERNLPVIPKAEVFAQVLTQDGEVVDASPRALRESEVLSKSEFALALRRRHTVEQAVPPRADQARLLVGAVKVGGTRFVIVVGNSLDVLEHAQSQLQWALGIALPVLALVVIAAGWLLVGSALGPVRAMVAEADDLSVVHRGQRLSVQGSEELAELARRLNAMLDRIETATDHEREFLDDASHELRTPIAIARGELELALDTADEHGVPREGVASALEEIERLQHLATSLLVLARTRTAGPRSDEHVDLRNVGERAVDVVRRARGTNGVALAVRGQAETTGDEPALERAVTNLVDNAARHAVSRVEVVVGQDDGEATVEVRDDGPGFPTEVLERAGDRFVRGSDGGAGLGLAITDAIVAAHHGRLELVTAPEGGALARVRIPAASAAPRE